MNVDQIEIIIHHKLTIAEDIVGFMTIIAMDEFGYNSAYTEPKGGASDHSQEVWNKVDDSEELINKAESEIYHVVCDKIMQNREQIFKLFK